MGSSTTQDRRAAFAALAPDLFVSRTANPRRYAGHPSGWRFVRVAGWRGPLVLAAPPGYRLSAAMYLVEGPAAERVAELLETAQETEC
jgi:hypothetical protein